jgi:GDPmannose 4,6-dehydratase
LNDTNWKRALIFGISGQDGSYLARFLIKKNYEVHGVTRKIGEETLAKLRTLGIDDRVSLHEQVITDQQGIRSLIHEIGPSEIYNLAGPSSVTLSERDPNGTREIMLRGAENILSTVKDIRHDAPRIFFAGSGDCYGVLRAPADEDSPFSPVSAYGRAKAEVCSLAREYRDRYQVFCVVGILFNHESPFRSETFVIGKVAGHVRRVLRGETKPIRLGDISVIRDWGWAPEYVDAMWRMLQINEPKDLIIASGRSERLETFISSLYGCCDLDWRRFVRPNFDRRPNEIVSSYANPNRALKELGWQAKITMEEMAARLVNEDHGENSEGDL